MSESAHPGPQHPPDRPTPVKSTAGAFFSGFNGPSRKPSVNCLGEINQVVEITGKLEPTLAGTPEQVCVPPFTGIWHRRRMQPGPEHKRQIRPVQVGIVIDQKHHGILQTQTPGPTARAGPGTDTTWQSVTYSATETGTAGASATLDVLATSP